MDVIYIYRVKSKKTGAGEKKNQSLPSELFHIDDV